MNNYRAIYTARIHQEIAQTPEEYLPLLLEMIHLFRQGISLKPTGLSSRQGWQEVLNGEVLPIAELGTGIDS